MKRTPFCFCPEVNSAMLFRDTQPIKLQKKHYSELEYMLMYVIQNASETHFLPYRGIFVTGLK